MHSKGKRIFLKHNTLLIDIQYVVQNTPTRRTLAGKSGLIADFPVFFIIHPMNEL